MGSLARHHRVALGLVALAASHTALGVWVGLFDGGDYSLLYFAVPFVGLTLLAALLVCLSPQWRPGVVQVPLVLAAVLAGLTVPLYLLGLFHLPQAVVAVGLVLRAERHRDPLPAG